MVCSGVHSTVHCTALMCSSVQCSATKRRAVQCCVVQCSEGQSEADPGIYLGGNQAPNRKLRAKPESRARSARVSRAKPESRARSARELRAMPEPRTEPKKMRGEGSGEGAR